MGVLATANVDDHVVKYDVVDGVTRYGVTTTGIERLLEALAGVALPDNLEVSLEFDGSHLRDVLVVREGVTDDECREALALAYHAATQAQSGSASVTIHVGPAIHKYLLSLCAEVDEARSNPPTHFSSVDRGHWYGYPIVAESTWDPTRVDVVARTVVSA